MLTTSTAILCARKLGERMLVTESILFCRSRQFERRVPQWLNATIIGHRLTARLEARRRFAVSPLTADLRQSARGPSTARLKPRPFKMLSSTAHLKARPFRSRFWHTKP